MQIAEPSIVAAACDTTVVTQFRPVEHALGGSGAPLMQFLDFVAFRDIGPFGMGGATLAAGLAPTGARILILERGEQLPDTSETRDARAIFQRGVYRPAETWIDGAGAAFNPGNYYYVGGNSKFYGAVLSVIAHRIFAPSFTPRERPRAGRSTMTRWSHGILAPRRCTKCAAPWARIRPSRGIPRPIRFRPFLTNQRSPRRGSE